MLSALHIRTVLTERFRSFLAPSLRKLPKPDRFLLDTTLLAYPAQHQFVPLTAQTEPPRLSRRLQLLRRWRLGEQAPCFVSLGPYIGQLDLGPPAERQRLVFAKVA